MRYKTLRSAVGMVLGAVFAVQAGTPPVGSGEKDAIFQTDREFVAALAKSEKGAVDKLLDAQFEWTDAKGKTRTRSESLEALAALAEDNAGDTDVKIHSYSELGIVFGFHHNARYGRIWVKRPAGWRVIVILDTSVPRQTAAVGSPASGKSGGDCDNPCRTLPFKPTTAADKAVLAEWQKTKVDEWHPDADDWATHVAEEFLIINERTERDKPTRVEFGMKQQQAGISMPGDPITSMTMYDFGDAVLMISHHVPYLGGKPYYNDRVFVHRGGHWLIAWSQQTTDEAASPLPAVGTSK
jgi:hypothetical protein